ncbi:MAG TPA: ATP-binding cassette domain-containing protein [Gaiellaceae bacterium]
MQTERPAATCIGVTKTYSTGTEQVQALRGVDAEFRHGAVSALVGASGSGKSSLLRLLAGLDTATDGKVLVEGHNLASLPAKELRRIRRGTVGYVFQRPADNFVPYLTVDEHLRLAAGRTPRIDLPGADELLDELGILGRRDHYPAELSGGEQQRAAFATVLMAGARLVVADEPTAELDSRSGEDLLRVVRRLAEDGTAFVIATHDANVRRMADDVIELEHGVVRDELTLAPAPPVRRGVTSSPDERPLVVVGGVTKTYRRGPELIHALDGVDLRLEAGRLIGLMGRSGSGKTTLLTVLAGWESPDSGAIAWDGEEGRVLADLPWADVAILPQKFGLMEELTVRENVEYPARLAGRLEEFRPRVEALLSSLGLAEFADRPPHETSVGQQQRSALARALVLRPRLVLADEPSGHQDAGWAHEVFRVLQGAAVEGTCCLVATHNEEIQPYLDIVHTMANGKLDTMPAETAGPAPVTPDPL